MISMARRARWGAKVAANGHGIVVHARAVLGELVGGDLVVFHVVRIGVAAGTGLRHIQGMNV